MKNFYLLIFLMLTLGSTTVYAQGDTCINNGFEAGINCSEAPLICPAELNGYCGTNYEGVNQVAPTNFVLQCQAGGVSIDNTLWISFVATSQNMTLTIRWENCTNGTGIQAEVWYNTSSGCSPMNSPDWEAVPGACITACNQGNSGVEVLNLNNLNIGSVYYFIVDGCGGAVCEYTVTTQGGEVPVPDPTQCFITGADPACNMCVSEYTMIYDIPGFLPEDLVWRVEPPTAASFPNGNSGKENLTVGVEWLETGTHTLCCESFIPCGDTFEICTQIEVFEYMDTTYSDIEVCESLFNSPGYLYTFPPTGEQRYITSPGVQDFEEYFGEVCCSRTVSINFTELEEPQGYVDTILCLGECLYFNQLGSCIFITNDGEYEDFFPNGAANGCDSTVIYSVLVEDLTVLTQQENPTCLGDDGAIFTEIIEGYPDFTYTWVVPPGADPIPNDEPSPTGLVEGDYYLTVTSDAGCISEHFFRLIEGDGPTAYFSNVEHIDCGGDATGELSINSDSDNLPFTFIWDGPVTPGNTPFGVNLVAGTYTVTVRDAIGCEVILQETLTEPESMRFDSATVLNAGCPGDSSGVIELFVSGGVLDYTYNWLPNVSVGSSATDLAAGDYSVTVTDDNGCQIDTSITIEQPPALSYDIATTDLVCNNECNGAVSVIATGGTPPYTYDWSDGSTGSPRTNLCAGNYEFTVTDSRGCTTNGSATLIEPPALALVVESTTDIGCNGASTGAIDISVSGGTPAYEFSWSNSATTEDLANIPAGTYAVTVTDDNGCQIEEQDIVIDEPPALEAVLSPTHITCYEGTNGEIQVAASGGSGTYVYTWMPPQGNVANAMDLPAGMYIVTIADAATPSCFIVDSVTLTQPDSLTINYTAQPAICGQNNGSVDLTVTGGTPTYTYDWPDPVADIEDPDGLGPQVYTVTVTDDNGCMKTADVSVAAPDGLMVVNGGSMDVSCNGGSDGVIDVDVSGGAPPYVLEWSNPAFNGLTDTVGVSAGIYTVTVTDADSCEVPLTVTIEEPEVLIVTGTAEQATCGLPNGSIDLMITGGTTPYSTVWSDTSLNGQVDPVNLLAGTYSVTVTDNNGCQDSFIIEVPTPPQLEVSFTQVNILCNGDSTGSIDVTVVGGTAPFDYDWNGTAYDGMQDLNNLPVGTYTLTVTDVNMCDSVIMVEITEPPALTLSGVEQHVSCNGGSDGGVTLTVGGGVGSYSYDWSNNLWDNVENPDSLAAGPISVTITDDNGCMLSEDFVITQPTPLSISSNIIPATCGEPNGSITVLAGGGTVAGDYTYTWSDSSAVGSMPTGLLPGLYILTLTDDNECELIDSFDVTTPNALTATHTKVDVDCYGDSTGGITVNITGGDTGSSYVIDWNIDRYDGMTDLTNLAAGIYSLTVTDGDDCQVFVLDTIFEPTELVLDATSENADCNMSDNGRIDVIAQGGVAPYSYVWTNGVSIDSFATGLSPMTYTITVTDANGCSKTIARTITEPDALMAQDTHEDISCNGGDDGSITLTVTGGTPVAGGTYNYRWADDTLLNTATRTGLRVGTYDVTIYDANDCELAYAVTLTEPDTIELFIDEVTDVDCYGNATGIIAISVTGGTGNMTYNWSDGRTLQDLNRVRAGCYVVTITDENNCVFVSDSICVLQPDSLSLSSTAVQATCGEANGSIDLTVTGGTMPYNFDWPEPIDDVEDPTGIFAGEYEVTVTDANGCMETHRESVQTPNGLAMSSTEVHVSCHGGNNGSILLDITGGSAPYRVDWSGGLMPADSHLVTGLTAGTYSVTVTDADTCAFSLDNIVISEPDSIITSFLQTQATCGLANGAIDLIVSGGVMPYTFNWDGGLMPVEDPQNVAAGNYNVTVTDANNCEAYQTVAVLTPPELIVSTRLVKDVNCNGGSDGEGAAEVVGGTAPFTYQWSAGNFNPTAPIVTGLPAGTHTVTVTDANNCTSVADITISEPTELTSIAVVESNANCNGGNEGEISVQVSGGTSPYDYDWDGSSSNGPIASNLTAGTYTVTVTDANGCTTISQESITEPQPLVATAGANSVSCFGGTDGSVIVTATGGTQPYSYNWSGGLAGVANPDTPIVAGTYTVIVTDDNGCTTTAQATVTQPDQIILQVTLEQYGNFNVSCAGESDGAAEVSISGGVAPYQIQWSDGQNGNMASNLSAPQTLQVTVTDQNGCSSTDEASLFSPEPLSISVSTRQPRCYGDSDGQIVVDSVSGGLGSYTYSYDGSPFTSNPVQNNVPVGTYLVVVQDIEGCNTSIEVDVNEPQEISVSLGEDMNINLGETVQIIPELTLNPGVPLDTFFWDLPSDYDCNAADPFALCIDTPFQSRIYMLRIIDENGCRAEDEMRVNVRKDREFWVPNVFSPNGDGHNDILTVKPSKQVKEIRNFYIFNRWGEQMFLAEKFQPTFAPDAANSWDGTFNNEMMDPGVFVYVAEVEFIDGEVVIFKGDVTLIR